MWTWLKKNGLKTLEGLSYAATIVALLGLYFEVQHANEAFVTTGKTIDDSRMMLVASNRAYVNATGLDVTTLGQERTARANLTVVVRNTGNTPTRALTWQAAHTLSRADEPLRTRVDLSATEAASGGVLAAEEENKTLVQLGELDDEQIAEIRMGRSRVAYFGALTYKDSFTNDPHLTRFCYEIVPREIHDSRLGISFRPCLSDGNCTDGECGDEDLQYLSSLR